MCVNMDIRYYLIVVADRREGGWKGGRSSWSIGGEEEIGGCDGKQIAFWWGRREVEEKRARDWRLSEPGGDKLGTSGGWRRLLAAWVQGF